MELRILAQHKHQGSARLLECNGNGLVVKAHNQRSDPLLYRFRAVMDPARFPSLTGTRLHTPDVFGIGPVDRYESCELRFAIPLKLLHYLPLNAGSCNRVTLFRAKGL